MASPPGCGGVFVVAQPGPGGAFVVAHARPVWRRIDLSSPRLILPKTAALALLLAAVLASTSVGAASLELLNVSYDPTRELYRAVNSAFTAQYQAKTGTEVTVR